MKDTNRSEAGFSMVEILISMLLLLMLSVGVLPLFTKAQRNNETGNKYLQGTNFARSQLEALRDLDFDSVQLTIPVGDTELKSEEYWSLRDSSWKTGLAPAGDPPQWLRTTTIRQYSNSDFNDDDLLNSPLIGGTSPSIVHVKEIIVSVENIGDGGVTDSGKALTLSYLKTF